MLGMMIPTPSISRNSVRKRIASARLSSTAPPVPPQRPPMIGTPYREVNRAEVRAIPDFGGGPPRPAGHPPPPPPPPRPPPPPPRPPNAPRRPPPPPPPPA